VLNAEAGPPCASASRAPRAAAAGAAWNQIFNCGGGGGAGGGGKRTDLLLLREKKVHLGGVDHVQEKLPCSFSAFFSLVFFLLLPTKLEKKTW
jgi:hypothetical protein